MFALLLVSLVAGTVVPVYTDEARGGFSCRASCSTAASIAPSAILLAWSASRRNDRWWRLISRPLAVLSVASQALLLVGYVPGLWAAGRGGGYAQGRLIP